MIKRYVIRLVAGFAACRRVGAFVVGRIAVVEGSVGQNEDVALDWIRKEGCSDAEIDIAAADSDFDAVIGRIARDRHLFTGSPKTAHCCRIRFPTSSNATFEFAIACRNICAD